ncbi:Retrovirus-related Pol polyprotein from transposon RE1 [Vitis vinifera]|uniref:Retrovirus-related Pol polyprotein from transposon RE1 n=1 Tax=Vitis vinifera TaxID=29760 RepID=A0A438KJZ2_VITVI|nr:Retrovirus-related Pol polyprotein from transposon RE1 [Vitis vinifera]
MAILIFSLPVERGHWKDIRLDRWQGFTQTYGIDCFETLALVAQPNTRTRYTWIPLLALKKGSIPRQGYLQGQTDHTMFMKFLVEGKVAIIIVYVDDIILTGDDAMEMDRLKKGLASKFKIKDLWSLRYFLGMKMAHSKKGMIVSLPKYILDLLRETGMSGCRPSNTLMDRNVKLEKKREGVPMDIARY